MAEITSELMYKQLQDRMSSFEKKMMRSRPNYRHCGFTQSAFSNTQNIYGMLTRHDTRLDRIERRLEISEATS